MSKKRLFRSEALSSRGALWLGEVLIVRPISFRLYTMLAGGALVSLIMMLFLGSYTKRVTLSGQLVPSQGLVKIYARGNGSILERFVEEGQVVKQGERLVRLSGERRSGDLSHVHAGVSDRIGQRRLSLRKELLTLKQIQAEETSGIQSKLKSLKHQLEALSEQIADQRRLVQLAADASNRYQGLREKGYISIDQLQQRQAELLGQRQKLQMLAREAQVLDYEFTERTRYCSQLSAIHQNQEAAIQRALLNVEQEFIESEAQRTEIVIAPQAGLVTAILAEPGQTIHYNRPLMTVLPEGSSLLVELYAPGRAVGFIDVGDVVMMRYHSFPYQKFGQHAGKIKSITKIALSAHELASVSGTVPGLEVGGEQVYQVRVEIEDQFVMANGESRPLRAGMLVEADILQESRHLYEWVINPIYSLTEKF